MNLFLSKRFPMMSVAFGLVCVAAQIPVLYAADSGFSSAAVQSSVGRVYKLSTDPESARKIAISFHDALLQGSWRSGELYLQLEPAMLAKLQAKGFVLQEADSFWALQQDNETKKRTQLSAFQTAGIPGYACYSTVEESNTAIDNLVTNYPGLARVVDIGDSWQKVHGQGGYDLRVLILGNQAVSGDKPKLFVHSAMHAREYATAELNLRFAKHLLESYGKEADASWILDNHEVHVLIQMNPDGRKKAESGLLWRKNADNNSCPNSNSRGIDLNRNFSFSWHAVANDGGSSSSQCSETYRGPKAASEPETQAVEAYVRSLYPDRRGPLETDAAPADTMGMHIDIHSYSELVLWPFGHVDTPAPNARALTTLGRKFAYFNRYYPEQSIGLYPTDGTSDDVSYGELGVPAFTFEIGTDFFQDCATFESTILPKNMAALMYAAKVVRAPYRLPGGPDVNSLQATSTATAVTLKGMASTNHYSKANGRQALATVRDVKAYLDTPPWQNGAQALLASADDGTFDGKSEAFSLTLSAAQLGDSRHIVYVQASNGNAVRGAVSALYVTRTASLAPKAQFTRQCSARNCQFDGSSSESASARVVDWSWDFGDGSTGSGSSVSHTYAQNGKYTVKLTASDGAGQRGELAQVFLLNPGNQVPSAEYSVRCNKLDCQFDGSASYDPDGHIASYLWNFGDNTEGARGVSVSHHYANEGAYQLRFSVLDDQGAETKNDRELSVSSSPIVPSRSVGGGGGGSSGGGAIGLYFLAIFSAMTVIKRKMLKK